MKTILIRIIFLLTILLTGCQSAEKHVALVDYVDPTIGNVGHLLQPTLPTVQLPNQMIRMHPVRADYLDDQIDFFPLTISSHRQPPLFGMPNLFPETKPAFLHSPFLKKTIKN
jgi:hypothetical protein